MPVNYGYLSDLTTFIHGNLCVGGDPGSGSSHSIGQQSGNQFHGGVLSVLSGMQFFYPSTASLNLNQAKIISIHSQTAASLSSSVLVNEEFAVFVSGNSATIGWRSGGVVWTFTSSASTVG